MSTSEPISFLAQLNQSIYSNITEVFTQNNFQHIKSQLDEPFNDYQSQWNIFYFVRLMFYVLVFLKIISMICFRKKKVDIKDRVYRKYLFSHAEMIKQFNEQDKQMMEIVLNNTIKNANLDKQSKMRTKVSNKSKSVNFYQQKNDYYDPKKNDDLKLDFLSIPQALNPQKINNFQIIEIIKQKVQTNSPLSEQDFTKENNLQKIQNISPAETQWQKND